MVTVLQ